MAKAKDLSGRRFGKLAPLCPTEKRADQGSVVWRCLCDCGNTCEVSARRLLRGKVRSCGCLSEGTDYTGKVFGRLTVLEYAGTAKELGRQGTMRYWRCRCACGAETLVGQTQLQNGESQSCGCLQKERLRESMVLVENTSVAILERNKTRLRTDNVSGTTGVSWDAKRQSWMAKITFQKKHYRLGRYKNKEDAIRARQEAEALHDGFLERYHAAAMLQKEK